MSTLTYKPEDVEVWVNGRKVEEYTFQADVDKYLDNKETEND